MKRKIKFLSCLFCILIGSVLFSACDLNLNASLGPVDENVDPIPSEISVQGICSEITVGEEVYSSLKVKQQLEGEWQEVVKIDYAVETDYDGTKYGDYAVKVYLVNYPHIKYETSVSVKPLTVSLPTYTTRYTGENIDIKSEVESRSGGLYSVTQYTKESAVGEYSAAVTLTNPDKYVWADDNGEILKGYTKSINWSITKAPAKTYTGESQLTVYYGDTLYDVAVENGLSNITWVDGDNAVVTNQTRVSAIYNESPGNYEDTYISIFFTEIVTTANYSVEYYLYDGSDYVIDNSRSSENLQSTIGEIITITPENIDGYVFDNFLSNATGKVLKDGSLVLQLYFNLLDE